jgi:hypothetical protein
MPIAMIPRQGKEHGDPSNTLVMSGSNRRRVRRALQGPAPQRNYRQHLTTPTALSIVESLPTVVKPGIRTVFGQLGATEVARKPSQRLSPAMSRRLRRRGRNVIQQASAMLQELEARRARQAREAEAKAKFKPQCSARTKLGTRCRKSAVADGYCTTHGA